jgi:hypothetical protein
MHLRKWLPLPCWQLSCSWPFLTHHIQIRDSPPAFDATWAWVDKPRSVHSYPHVKLTTPALPARLSNISALLLSAQWSMGPGSRPRPVLSVDDSGLSQIGASANVAFDIFADRNPRFAGSAKTAETEVMIWLGKFGDAQPLGFASGSVCLNITLANTDLQVFTRPRCTTSCCTPTDSQQRSLQGTEPTRHRRLHLGGDVQCRFLCCRSVSPPPISLA